MPTVSEILDIAAVSQYLASNDVAKGSLFGNPRLRPIVPSRIWVEKQIIQAIYDGDHNYDGLQEAADYLYAMLYHPAQASAIVNNSNGGSISPITPSIPTGIYPLVITAADMEIDGVTYNNPNIVGDNLMVFVQQYNEEWLYAPDFFQYTGSGIVIVAAGFDANNYGNIIIQKFNSP